MSEGKIGAQELKPCPFCGQEAYRSGSIVCCSNRECRAEIHFIYDEELYGEAIKDGVEAWNRRTAPPRDLTPEEALEEARKRWGNEAWVSFDTRSGTIEGEKYGPYFVGVAVRDEKGIYHGINDAWNAKTFREAFAKASESENIEKPKTGC